MATGWMNSFPIVTNKLALSGLYWEALPRDYREAILSNFKAIKDLEILQARFRSPGTILDVVCSFNHLEKFSLEVFWNDWEVSTQMSDKKVLPLGLHNLGIINNIFNNDDLLNEILSFRELPAISSVHLAGLDHGHIHSSTSLLHRLGPKLHHLEVMFFDTDVAGACLTIYVYFH